MPVQTTASSSTDYKSFKFLRQTARERDIVQVVRSDIVADKTSYSKRLKKSKSTKTGLYFNNSFQCGHFCLEDPKEKLRIW